MDGTLFRFVPRKRGLREGRDEDDDRKNFMRVCDKYAHVDIGSELTMLVGLLCVHGRGIVLLRILIGCRIF
eukprot:766321-Hanusia_phi.AAC.1